MTNANSNAAILQIINARSTAVSAGDVDAMMADLADDIVTFDVVNPLRRDGKAASRARAEAWIASYDGSIGWESRDVVVSP